jgi:pimeloyl-ACP methyl ester carboxylesterase
VLLCDARNHSQSDSDAFSSLPRFAEDLGQAIAWCLATPSGPVRPRLEAARHRDIAALVSIGAFAHPAEVTQRTLRRLRLPRFVTLLVIRYVEWLIGYRFDNIAPINTVCRITFLVLLVRGRDDETVPVDDARRIADRCHAPQLRLLVVRGAGHGSTDQNQGNAGDLQRFLDANRAALA